MSRAVLTATPPRKLQGQKLDPDGLTRYKYLMPTTGEIIVLVFHVTPRRVPAETLGQLMISGAT